jgi:tripartite-type tricarboxylate transporter receptor subunit TctC
MVAISSQSQSFPSKPVRIITNLPVASAPDTVARKMSKHLTDKWNVPVVIENKPGAGGVVAMEYFLNNLYSDSHAILMLDSGAHITMPLLYQKEKEINQLKLVWPHYTNYWVVVAPSSTKNWRDLQISAKDKLFYGSWGVGSMGHLCGAELAQKLKINNEHVGYREFGVWFGDLANHQLAYSCSTIGSTEQYVKSGKLNWIAITAPHRDPEYPTIPTLKELTGQDFKVEGGYVVFFTHISTADDAKNKLAQGIREVLEYPDVSNSIRLLARGKTWAGTAEQFEINRQQTISTYRELIKQFGIKVK